MSGDLNPSVVTNSLTGNGNIDEVIYNYGTFELDFSGAFCTGSIVRSGDCSMSLDFSNTIALSLNSSGILIAGDSKSIGSNQLLYQRGSTIHLIDNIFTNSPPDFEIEVSPCLSLNDVPQKWKINTTVGVTVQNIVDPEEDTIEVTVILYEGSTNEHEQKLNFTGGVGGNTFLFTANKTATNQT